MNQKNQKIHRGRDFCRACDSTSLFPGVDLGLLPIANELLSHKMEEVELFPLCLYVCSKCGLGQVEDLVFPSRLFEDYRYLSSISSTFLAHSKNFVEMFTSENIFKDSDWVLEIASNDGYLLKNFVERGITCLGVEPAKNIAQMALDQGIPTISEFFGTELAKRILKEKGYPRLIIGNNVFAHVPDIQDFIQGLAILAGEDTLISLENPSIMNILEDNQFDTIYHEHFSYLSVTCVSHLAQKYNLQLFSVDEINTHGGSNRYWLRQSSSDNPLAEIEKKSVDELARGLTNWASWQSTQGLVDKVLQELVAWLEINQNLGNTVVGYGAAAKASTLLNAARIPLAQLSVIADKSPEKQGRFMPVPFFSIIGLEDLISHAPTDILIFPWNIAPEISRELSSLIPNVRTWVAIPSIRQVI